MPHWITYAPQLFCMQSWATEPLDATLSGHWLCQFPFDALDQLRGLGRAVRPETCHDGPVTAEQKLLKIPRNRPCRGRLRVLRRQVIVEGALAWPIDVHFGEHRKGDPIALLAKGGNLGCRARLLLAELIAGKPQHRKPLG